LAGVQYAIGDLKADDSPSGLDSTPPVPPPATVEKITAAVPGSAPSKPRQPRKLLVYTRSIADWRSRYVSTPFIAKAIEIIGTETGAFQATVTDAPAAFEADKLAQFDGVCLVNTSGGLFFSKDELRSGGQAIEEKNLILLDCLLQFVEDGKGLVGIHAVECPRDCPEFADMLGAVPHWKPWQKGVVQVESQNNPINGVFRGRDEFEIVAPIYRFREPYSREHLRVLLSLNNEKSGIFDDKRGYHGREDRDHALSWIKSHGEGRVYYNAFGGKCAIAWNSDVLAHWLAGIQYALGDLKADASPSRRTPK
jgi:type 1 glutamine amidotransferase